MSQNSMDDFESDKPRIKVAVNNIYIVNSKDLE